MLISIPSLVLIVDAILLVEIKQLWPLESGLDSPAVTAMQMTQYVRDTAADLS